MFQYYDTEDEAVVNNQTSVALFRQSDWGQETTDESSKIVVMVGQYDSEEILGANFAFLEEYREKVHSMPLLETMEGQPYKLRVGDWPRGGKTRWPDYGDCWGDWSLSWQWLYLARD